jgi:glutamyl-tRNA(Gln) amidotransferase subunit E
MYPETDVPPIRITGAHWQDVLSRLPAKPEEIVAHYVAGGLSEDLAKQIVRDGSMIPYDTLADAGVDVALAGRIVTQFIPALDHPDSVLTHAADLGTALSSGILAKEAVQDVLKALDEGAPSVAAAIETAGATAADQGAVDAVIAAVIAERIEFVRDRGMGAIGPLMGPVMAELRGKADGALISDRLKAAIEKATQ